MSTPAAVIGIDLSLTATGIVHGAYPRNTTTELVVTDNKTSDLDRIGQIVREIRSIQRRYPERHLIVIEAPFVGGHASSALRIGKLHGVIEWELTQYALDNFTNPLTELVYVPPATVKKYATGKGNANKLQMILAVRDRIPELGEIDDDNIADAAWLWAIGCDLSGRPIKIPKAQRAAIDKHRTEINEGGHPMNIDNNYRVGDKVNLTAPDGELHGPFEVIQTGDLVCLTDGHDEPFYVPPDWLTKINEGTGPGTEGTP